MAVASAPLRKKRARLVCVECHDRKLRCDLEARSRAGLGNCANCADSESVCQPRAPKRRRRRLNGVELHQNSSFPALQPAPAVADCAQVPIENGLEQQNISAASEINAYDAHQGGNLQLDDNFHPPALPEPRQASLRFTESSAAEQTPGRLLEASPAASNGSAAGYLGDVGFLRLFEPDTRRIANEHTRDRQPTGPIDSDLPPLELQQSFVETYLDYCWPWCPVLDQATLVDSLENPSSPLLVNALALLGSRIRPPLIQHASAGEYYRKAKMLFYTDGESNDLICLQAIMLFYWWAPRGPSIVHKDSAWWWTGLAIKYAQQMGLHREPQNTRDPSNLALQGLRRRVWWTLFARERLTAFCQGRPCTINPEDCNVREPSVEDFGPSPEPRCYFFIHWVRLCGIIGRIGQHLTRNTDSHGPFPTPLAVELIDWVRNLPELLALPSLSSRIRRFDRDVFKLHLPYLTTITILHLNWSTHHPSLSLPEAYTTAVLAASCVAKLFKDLLARGELRFLGAMACWHVGVAIVALLHTQRIEKLAESAAEDIHSLRLALDELAKLWPTAQIFVKGFKRLRAFDKIATGGNKQGHRQLGSEVAPSPALSDPSWTHGIDCQSYFPFISAGSYGLPETLLAEHQSEGWGDMSWLGDAPVQLQDLFGSTDLFPEMWQIPMS